MVDTLTLEERFITLAKLNGAELDLVPIITETGNQNRYGVMTGLDRLQAGQTRGYSNWIKLVAIQEEADRLLAVIRETNGLSPYIFGCFAWEIEHDDIPGDLRDMLDEILYRHPNTAALWKTLVQPGKSFLRVILEHEAGHS